MDHSGRSLRSITIRGCDARRAWEMRLGDGGLRVEPFWRDCSCCSGTARHGSIMLGSLIFVFFNSLSRYSVARKDA